MGYVWQRGSAAEFQNLPQKLVEKMRNVFFDQMDEVITLAAEQMRNNIATRGTGYEGRAGRVDSGDMLQSVETRIIMGDSVVTGEFGWFDEEMYFIYQEKGFTHYLSGEMIEPMFAKRDAAIWSFEELLRRLHTKLGSL